MESEEHNELVKMGVYASLAIIFIVGVVYYVLATGV